LHPTLVYSVGSPGVVDHEAQVDLEVELDLHRDEAGQGFADAGCAVSDPAEDDLFAACSQHYYEVGRWPDPERWRAIADPAERLAAAVDGGVSRAAVVELASAMVSRASGR
jgi:hypothetical protein